MKATLEFNLDEREDILAHRRCSLALDMAIDLYNLRSLIIHLNEREELSEDLYSILMEGIRDDLDDLMD